VVNSYNRYLCGSRVADFQGNPIEPIDLQTKVSRVYDEWVRQTPGLAETGLLDKKK
jgi:hypothetical protein